MKMNREHGKAMTTSERRKEHQSIVEMELGLRETEAIIEYVLTEFDKAVDKLRNDYELTHLKRHWN